MTSILARLTAFNLIVDLVYAVIDPRVRAA